MNKKITISVVACLAIVLVACFSLVIANGVTTNSIHNCNMGTVSIDLPARPYLIFGAFDKFHTSSLGAADCIDLFVLDPDTGGIVLLAIVTDSEAYQEFYVTVFQGMFAEENIVLVEPNQLDVSTKGSDIYVELTDAVTFDMDGEAFVLPPFTLMFDSFDTPSHQTNPASYLPSGWSYTREVWRGYNAVATFMCPELGVIMGTKALGSAMFNTVDTFIPPPPAA